MPTLPQGLESAATAASPDVLLALALMAAAGSMAAVAALRRWLYPLSLAAFYALAGVAALTAVLTQATPMLIALAGGAALAQVLAAALFVCPRGSPYVFAGLGLAIFCAAAGGALLGGALAPGLLMATVLLGCVGSAGLVFMQVPRGGLAPALFAAGALAPAMGSAIAFVELAGLAPLGPLALAAPWAGLGLHYALTLAAMARALADQAKRRRLIREQKRRKARALAQLREDKTAQEQAHLMRLIEQERSLMAELRGREQERTEQMRQAKEVADEANRAKSAFLAVVSHEIRTPMTGILGMLRLMEGSGLSRDQKDYVVTMRRSSDAMMRLLNDILDLEKMGSGQMEMERLDFDLHQLIGGIVTLMSAHAAEKGLVLGAELDDALPHYVVGDPARLRQVILNLVSNAIKFTKRGSVTIAARPRGEAVEFAITDTGIGIPVEAQERLFTPFSQAESATARKYGGTGLGLAICKEIVEAMGGTIGIESLEGKGTTFRFALALPTGTASGAAEALFGDKDEDGGLTTPPMEVLVVEDNAINQRIVRALLEAHGHTPTCAQSAEEGLDRARAKGFGVILMDVNLSGMSGVEATRTLRAAPDSASAAAPVIALTGNVGDGDVEGFYAAGMNDFVPKPVRPAALYAALDRVHRGALENPVETGGIAALADPATPPVGGLSLEDDAAPSAPAAPEEGTPPPAQDTQDSEAIWAALGQGLELPESEEGSVVLPEPEPEPEPQAQQEAQQNPPPSQDDIDAPLEMVLDDLPELQAPASETATPEPEQEQDPKPEPALDSAPEPQEPEMAQDFEGVLDTTMLRSLRDSVGAEQIAALMESFWDKAQELVAALTTAANQGQGPAMGARGHELKGMAGNFGMAAMAALAGQIERAAKMSQNDQAVAAANALPEALEKARAAFAQWTQQED